MDCEKFVWDDLDTKHYIMNYKNVLDHGRICNSNKTKYSFAMEIEDLSFKSIQDMDVYLAKALKNSSCIIDLSKKVEHQEL